MNRRIPPPSPPQYPRPSNPPPSRNQNLPRWLNVRQGRRLARERELSCLNQSTKDSLLQIRHPPKRHANLRVVEVPADADRMDNSADTPSARSSPNQNPHHRGAEVFASVREAAPPALHLASGFAAMSRMAPRTASLHLHSTPAISAAAAVNAHSGARVVRHSAARSSPHRPLVG